MTTSNLVQRAAGLDFGAVGGPGNLRQIIGALLTYGLIVACLMLIISAAAWAISSSNGSWQSAAKAKAGVFVALGGAAFADGLDLDAPERYAEAAVMFGTLPFDAGVPVAAGRLSGVPTFAAQGEADYMIPRELLDNTWACILADSGSPVIATRDPGDHQLSHQTVHESHRWLSQRAHFLRVRPESTGAHELAWVGLGGVELPERAGPRADASWTIPQQQTNQNAPIHLQERLFDEVSNLAGVSVSESRISVPGARAFTVDNPSGDADAFLVPQVHEFAHIHPGYDGSLDLALPESLAAEVSAKVWGRPHMWAGTRLSPGFMLVYGPRDEAELDVIRAIVATSHAYATASAS